MTAPSPVPVRYPSGVSTDFHWGILSNYGAPNPAKYHTYFDDFDWLNAGNTSSLYTATKTGTSAALASQSGDGGQLLFTTGTASGNVTVLTTAVSPFVIPVLPKRMFYMARLQMSNITTVGFWAGLVSASGAPVTTVAGITDGIYFTKANNSATAINAVIVSGSTVQATIAIPSNVVSTYLLANTWLDLGFAVTRLGGVDFYLGYPYVGYTPQQQTPPTGLVAAYSTQLSGNLTFSTATLAPTIIAQAGSTAQPTLTLDFQMAAVER